MRSPFDASFSPFNNKIISTGGIAGIIEEVMSEDDIMSEINLIDFENPRPTDNAWDFQDGAWVYNDVGNKNLDWNIDLVGGESYIIAITAQDRVTGALVKPRFVGSGTNDLAETPVQNGEYIFPPIIATEGNNIFRITANATLNVGTKVTKVSVTLA